jgi:glycosyltransferase involved in cell wall biosynthesis
VDAGEPVATDGRGDQTGDTLDLMPAPLVSVVMPAFNAEARIGNSLASVLAQTYDRIEVIVVDDGSTDDTAEAARRLLGGGRFPYRVERQENKGPSSARNRGWQLAQGEWIQLLDDDDLISPKKIALQVEALPELGEAPAFIVSTWRRVDPHGEGGESVRPLLGGSMIETLLRPDGFMPFAAGLMSRAWLSRVGGFDDKLTYIEDVDLQLRLIAAGGRFAEAPADEPQFFYRMREGSLSRSSPEAFIQGCLRNAGLALQLARSRGQVTPALRRLVCDVLAQGVVFYAERDAGRADELIARIRTLDPRYIRKGRLFRILASVTGWPLAERVAARTRSARRAVRAGAVY